jgi:hypothetical protein
MKEKLVVFASFLISFSVDNHPRESATFVLTINHS